MEGACYLFVFWYLMCIQSITNTNGLRLPFSSITSKSTPVKPKSSLNCSSSISTGSTSSGTTNTTPKPLDLSPILYATCQENLPFVNLNSLPTKAHINSPNLLSAQNYFQVLPKVNFDSTASVQCVNNVDSHNTFKVQNSLSSTHPTLPGVNLYSFGQLAKNANIKNDACENTFKIQNPVLSNAISGFNPRPSIISSSNNAFDNTFVAESPMISIFNGNNNIGYPNTLKIKNSNTLSSNCYQELPEVNLKRNPTFSSNALASAIPILNDPSNQAFNFLTNECLASNPFSIPSLTQTPSKYTPPVLLSNASPCPETSIPQKTIALPNLNHNFHTLLDGFYPTSTFTATSDTSNLSSSQNKLNSFSSYLEPQLSFNSVSLPTCNIDPTSSNPFLNNLYYNFNVSPISQTNPSPVSSLSQTNFNLGTLCLEPKLSDSVSSYNNFQPSNPYSINAVSNNDLNRILSPSYLGLPTLTTAKEITTQTFENNQIKSLNGLNSLDSFPPKSFMFIDSTQNSANMNPFLSSSVNSLTGVSIGCNSLNQSTDNFGSSISQNIQFEYPSLKQTSVPNQNIYKTFQTDILNGFDTIPASDLPSSLQILKNTGTVPSIQNVMSPQLTNPPKWNNFCSNDGIGPTSQIVSSNPFVSKTGPYTSDLNILPDVTLSNLKVSNYPQSISFSSLDQTPTPFNIPQNCQSSQINPSLDTWLSNLPLPQLSYLPGLSIPTVNSNSVPPFSNGNAISSSNFLFPSQTCESNFPQKNTISPTMFSSLGVSSLDSERKVLSNCDSAKDNQFVRPSVPSNTESFINPKSTYSKMVPNTIIPQSLLRDIFQPDFFSNMNSLNCPSVNLPICLNPVSSFSNFQIQNSISPPNSFEPSQAQSRVSPNNCPDSILYLSSPVTNCPSGINTNVKLPNCGLFDSSPYSISSNDFDLGPIVNIPTNDFNYESVVNTPNYATFNSDPYNNAVNYIPLTILPEVSCCNDISIYQTAINSNGLSSLTNLDVPNFSVLKSASPINYINTCSESVSPISEFTSSLTKSILDGVFSGDLTFKPKSKIPMTLPPVNPYSNQVNSIPSFNNIYSPSVFQDTSSKFLEYPQSGPIGSNSLRSDVIGFDSYSNYYYPLTSDKVWSDNSYDFTSRIPLNNLPSVIPYTNGYNGNFQPSIPSLLSTPSFSSSYQSSSSYSSDLELLFDTYSDSLSSLTSDLSWMDYVDSYDYYEPELFTDSHRQSYPCNFISRPDYAGLTPFCSDTTYSSPSFLPSTNLMSSFAYPPPVIKVKDSQESKELERLLEYIVLLEMVDNNYNCDWDLLERLIAMLYAFD